MTQNLLNYIFIVFCIKTIKVFSKTICMNRFKLLTIYKWVTRTKALDTYIFLLRGMSPILQTKDFYIPIQKIYFIQISLVLHK